MLINGIINSSRISRRTFLKRERRLRKYLYAAQIRIRVFKHYSVGKFSRRITLAHNGTQQVHGASRIYKSFGSGNIVTTCGFFRIGNVSVGHGFFCGYGKNFVAYFHAEHVAAIRCCFYNPQR